MVDEKVKRAVVGDKEENPRTKHPPCKFFCTGYNKGEKEEHNFYKKKKNFF